jgi:hypothetical protein
VPRDRPGRRPLPQPGEQLAADRIELPTLDHLCARNHDPIVDGARMPSNNEPVAPARSTATSSMLSPPASIDPITVNAFVPLLAPCLTSLSRWSTKPARSIRCARTAAGSSPAFGTRLLSSKVVVARLRS